MHSHNGCCVVGGALIWAMTALTLPADEAVGIGRMRSPKATDMSSWTMATDDTAIRLAIREGQIVIESLKNPKQDWNWTPAPCVVPLPGNVVVGGKPQPVTWAYREGAVKTDGDGTTLTVTFVCADPALELRSVWRTRPGAGPVEHQMTIRNNSKVEIAFSGADLTAADLKLVSDATARAFPVAEGKLGYGESLPLPFQMLQVGTNHGLYLAYDYGCGRFSTRISGSNITSRWWAEGIKDTGTPVGQTFRCPGIYIQAYRGDEDDGANRFRRWFWRYEITRSLYNTPTDPPIELCEWPYYDGKPDLLIARIREHQYGKWGVGLWKTDYWHSSTKDAKSGEIVGPPGQLPTASQIAGRMHAKSEELVKACAESGMQVSLYWCGPQSEETLAAEYERSKFHYYRMDQFRGGVPFQVDSYKSFTDFNRKIDNLHRKYGLKLENCCNGGNLRSLDLFRRMTFMTHSDTSGLKPFFRHISDWSYLMCPVQIKNDYALNAGDGVAEIRGMLLGAILTIATAVPSDWPADWFGGKTKPGELPPHVLEDLKRVFLLYSTKQRAILRGCDVFHIQMPAGCFGIQYFNTFISRGSVLLWGEGEQTLRLKGLDRNVTYGVSFEDGRERNSMMTGAQLMDEGLLVNLGTNKSEIIWINDTVPYAKTVSFTMDETGENPPPQTSEIVYRLGPEPNRAFTLAPDVPWLKAETVSGAGNGQLVRHTVDLRGRPSGIYTAKVGIARPDLACVGEYGVTVRVNGLPRPVSLKIEPAVAVVFPGGQRQVAAVSLDQFGAPYTGPVVWQVSGGGSIDRQGLFASHGKDGEYEVCARLGDLRATARLVVGAGLVARWKLNEGKGDMAADSWGGNPGRLIGGAGWTNGPSGGGGAVTLNGSGQYIDTGTCFPGLQVPFSIVFWVRPAATQVEYADIFGNHEGSSVGMVLQQNGKAHNEYAFGYGGAPAGGIAGPVRLKADVWQSVVIVCDGTNVIASVDGVEQARGEGRNALAPNRALTFRLGAGYKQGRFFRGGLSDFRLYGRALSREEIGGFSAEGR